MKKQGDTVARQANLTSDPAANYREHNLEHRPLGPCRWHIGAMSGQGCHPVGLMFQLGDMGNRG